MYFLYSFFLGLALLVSAPFLLMQRKHRPGFRERLGRLPERIKGNPGNPNIWIHAVSVGEVLAITPLVEHMREQLPASRIFISTTTATGQALARQRFGERNVFYFPFDLSACIRPYLRGIRPALVVTAETEFWPNLLRLARRAGARIAVVNARISDRSLRGYRRWRLLLRGPLARVDLFLAQTPDDARRLASIGAAPEKIRTTGNLKFDVAKPASLPIVQDLRNAFLSGGAKSVLVCGSTVASPAGNESEEEMLLAAFSHVLQTDPTAVLLLAPRKPERFEHVATLIESRGLPLWRRSRLAGHEAIAGGVLLLDSIGELASLYQLGTVALVGGSLVPAGGHNILEPAQTGVPVLVGPYTQNFRDIIRIFRRTDAVVVVIPEAEQIARCWLALLSDAEARTALGTRARQTFDSQAGATARTADALLGLLGVHPEIEESRHAERLVP